MSKSKKAKQQAAAQPETSVLDWYEHAGRHGYLDQNPKKKETKEAPNRLDQEELHKLAAFKKDLMARQADEKQEAAHKAKQKEKETFNDNWFEAAEKQGYLDHQ